MREKKTLHFQAFILDIVIKKPLKAATIRGGANAKRCEFLRRTGTKLAI